MYNSFQIIKTEFAFNRIFNDFEELERELFDYVNWYNNIRIHGSLEYKTPIEYRSNDQKQSQGSCLRGSKVENIERI